MRSWIGLRRLFEFSPASPVPQSITGVWETWPSLLALSPWGLILDVQGLNLVSARAAWLSRTPLHLSLFREGKGKCEIILNFHQVVSKAPHFIKRQVLQHPSCSSWSRGEISMLWKIMNVFTISGENRWASGIEYLWFCTLAALHIMELILMKI